MTAVDIWAAASTALAGAFLFLRGEMLKTELGGYHNAPPLVRWTLTAASIALGGRTVTLLSGGHAQAADAAVYTALAVSAAVMFWNLRRQTTPVST